ncbi:hypothetical protein ACWGRV_17875 [Streptomyces sp. NPDC055663]
MTTIKVLEADPCGRVRIIRYRTPERRRAANPGRADAYRPRSGRQAISAADSVTERLHRVRLGPTHPRERTAP